MTTYEDKEQGNKMINTNAVFANGKSVRLSPGKCVVCASDQAFGCLEKALLPSKNKFYGVSENRRISFYLCSKCNSTHFEKDHESGFPQGEALSKIVQAAIKAYPFKADEEALKAELKAISEQFDQAEKCLAIEAPGEALKLINDAMSRIDGEIVSPLHQERGVNLACRAYETTNHHAARAELMKLSELRKGIFGPESKEFADSLFRLGNAELLTNNAANAEDHFLQCLKIAETTGTPDPVLIKKLLIKALVHQKKTTAAMEYL